MKTQTMTGVIAEANESGERRWGHLRIRGDDGRDYYVGHLMEYLDLDQRLRPPGPEGKDVDYKSRWIGCKGEFEYTEHNSRLLILRWIHLERRL